jgi:hypothetical protein
MSQDEADYDERSRSPQEGDKAKPRNSIWPTLVELSIVIVISLSLAFIVGPCLLDSRTSDVDRLKSSNNLKMIAWGCHSYADAFGGLPTNSYTRTGEPLLSWRVHLLPFVEQEALYKEFKLDEPWDSPANKRLLPLMPSVYVTPTGKPSPQGFSMTHYRGFTHKGAIFEPRSSVKIVEGIRHPVGVRFNEIMDLSSNTILVVEATTPVEWTKPDNFDGSEGKPLPPLGKVRPHSKYIVISMCNGATQKISNDTAEHRLRNATTYAGGETDTLD